MTHGNTPDLNDDDDLELEPVDEELLAGERRRTAQALNRAEAAIDIDGLYRDSDKQSDFHLDDFKFRFQFQIKHLLWLTASLAIFLSLGKTIGYVAVLFIGTFLTIAGAYGFITWKERQRQQELDRQRDTLYKKAKKQRFSQSTAEPSLYDEPLTPDPSAVGEEFYDAESKSLAQNRHGENQSSENPEPSTSIEPDNKPWFDLSDWKQVQFQFSLKQLMITMAIACVALWLFMKIGSAAVGFLAVGGLVAQAFGAKPPAVLVLCWWVILVLYVVIGFGMAFVSMFTG